MDIKEALEISVIAAIAAGEEIMKIYNDPNSDFGVERKSDNSPLTIADKKAHTTIIGYLNKLNIPIISEEGRNISYCERKNWKKVWIVDPLDGTKEFIKKNGEFTVNIALVEDGAPIMGVIYIPATKTVYYGNKEIGSFKAENCTSTLSFSDIVKVSTVLPLKDNHEGYIVVASRSHLGMQTEQFVETLREKHQNILFKSKGSSLKITLIAEGSADIYPRFAPTMEWDTAAGDGILRSMGMKLRDAASNNPLQYNKEDLLNPYFIAEYEL